MSGFEREWFFQCTVLAQNELLESQPLPLDYRKVIALAKEIYREGLLLDIKELVKDERITDQEPTAKKGFKICPGCGEEIPEGWEVHLRKKTGEKCGYSFK